MAGTFDSVSLPAPSLLLSFSLDQQPQTIEVIAAAQPFTTMGRNRVERAVARHLDAIAPTASGDLADVMGEMQFLSDSGEMGVALISLSPETYDGLTRAANASAKTQTSQPLARLGVLRAGGPVSERGESSFTPAHLAYGGSSQSLAGLFDAEKTLPGKQGLWLEAFGQRGNQGNDSDGYTGFNSNVAGITLGYDRELGNHWVAGTALAYSRTDLDFVSSQANGDVSGCYLSLYGSWNKDGAYAQGIMSYGRNNYDQQRRVNVGGIDRLAMSDHDGNVWAANLSGGFMTSSGAWGTAAPMRPCTTRGSVKTVSVKPVQEAWICWWDRKIPIP